MKMFVVLSFLGASVLALGCDGGNENPSSSGAYWQAITRSMICGEWRADDEIPFQQYLYDHMYSARMKAYIDGIVNCINAATTCDGALRCEGLLPDQTCSWDTFENSCSGTILSSCSSAGYVKQQDCADDLSGNTLCDEACFAGTCSEENTRCDGDILLECWGSKLHREDCTLESKTCVELDTDSAACVLQATCTEDSCSGNTAVHCGRGHEIARVDCAEVLGNNGTCQLIDGETECVMKAGTEECQDTRGSTCEGNSARVCVAGKVFRFDCSSFQNGRCVAAPDEYEPEYTVAHCERQ